MILFGLRSKRTFCHARICCRHDLRHGEKTTVPQVVFSLLQGSCIAHGRVNHKKKGLSPQVHGRTSTWPMAGPFLPKTQKSGCRFPFPSPGFWVGREPEAATHAKVLNAHRPNSRDDILGLRSKRTFCHARICCRHDLRHGEKTTVPQVVFSLLQGSCIAHGRVNHKKKGLSPQVHGRTSTWPMAGPFLPKTQKSGCRFPFPSTPSIMKRMMLVDKHRRIFCNLKFGPVCHGKVRQHCQPITDIKAGNA